MTELALIVLALAVIGLLIVLLQRQRAAERHLRGLEKAAAIRQQAIDEILGTPHYTIPPPPRTPSEHRSRARWGMGGLAAVPVIAWAREHHVPTMLAVAAVGGVLTLTPSLAPHVSESPPQAGGPTATAPPLEPGPPAPTGPDADAETDVEQGEQPPATDGSQTGAPPVQTTDQAQAPEGPLTNTEPAPGGRRQQPTPGPKSPDEPEEVPSQEPEEPNGPPRPCLEVTVPPEVHVPACLGELPLAG